MSVTQKIKKVLICEETSATSSLKKASRWWWCSHFFEVDHFKDRCLKLEHKLEAVIAPSDAVYKGMHKKAKQSKITAFFTVTLSTIHSTSIMLINFQPETPAQMTACFLSHLASKLIVKCKVFTIIYTKSHVSRVYNVVNLLWLQLIVHVMLVPFINVLYLYISTFQNICSDQHGCFL